MKKKVAFFYPSRDIGGAQVLFARVADILSCNDYKVYNVDYGSSFITTSLSELGTEFTHVVINDNNSKKLVLPEDCVYILPLSYVFEINSLFPIGMRCEILFWDLHPYNLIDYSFFSFFYKVNSNLSFLLKKIETSRICKLKNFLNLANKNNSLYFMCSRNFQTNRLFFDLDFVPSYIPIPVSQMYTKSYSEVPSKNVASELHIAWMSRLASDKVKILNLLICDLITYARSNENIKVVLHVIGGGDSTDEVLFTEYIEFRYAGVLYEKKLIDYTLDKIDLAFSMGASALDFAAMSTPTILVPNFASYSDFQDRENKYIWLHEIDGFDVAVESYHDSALNIFEVMTQFSEAKSKVLAEMSRQYVLENHSMDNTVKLISDAIQNTNLTYNELRISEVYKVTFIELLILRIKSITKYFVSKF